PFQGEDFGRRVTAHRRRRRNLALMPPPGLRGYVRFPKPTFLKPEVARSLFPRLIGRNHHFLAFVEATGLDAAKNLTRRRISIVSCVVRSFSLVPCNHASTCTRRRCALCCLLQSHSDSWALPSAPAARQRIGPYSRCNDAEAAAMGIRLQAPLTPWRRGWRWHPSRPAKGSHRVRDAALSIEIGPRPSERAERRTR